MKPGDKVLDLIPGSGYWTRIFSRLVGPSGKVYAVWPQGYAREAMGNVADLRRLSADKYYGNVVVEVQPIDGADARPSRSTSCGRRRIFTIIRTSSWARAIPTQLAKDAYNILKPGGTFMVIDHMAKPGRGLADTDTLHRIDPAAVRKIVEGAGFRFAGESKVLDNPADPLDIPVFDRVDPRAHEPVRLQVREAAD